MNNLWYSFRELKNSWIFKVIVLIQITIAIILLYRVNEIKNYEYGKLNLMQTIINNKTIYTMMSKYQSKEEFEKDCEITNKFSTFYEAVQKKYKLVTAIYGEILVKDFKNLEMFQDVELKDYSDEDGYKIINSLQCSSNFFDSFDIKLSNGDLSEFISCTKLNSTDMEGKTIPIVLGDSYKGIFNLNDTIQTKFRYYKVVGFLEQNQFYLDKGIYDPSRAKSLNTFMIVPSPINIVIANVNNSILISDNSKNSDFGSIQKNIDELAKKSDVKLSINDPKENIDSFAEMINYDANIKILITYIVIFFVAIGLLAIFSNRINARRKEFSLHIMHGATYKDIYIYEYFWSICIY